MIRIAQLIRTAGQVRRLIWASLPFRLRLAEVLCRLASSTTDVFGTGMYGVFLEHGVDGMPPINGKPAAEWVAQHSVRRLPSAYGRDFGKKAFSSLMLKYHNPEIVEDLLSTFMVRFIEKAGKYLKSGTSLREAEAYVMRSLYNEGINVLRRKRWEVGESTLNRDDDDRGGYLERVPTAEPEESEAEQEEHFNDLLVKLRPKLRRIHESAEQYLRLLAEGHSDTEILGNPGQGRPSMLDHPYNANGGALTPSAWNPYKVKIKHLIYPLLKGRQDVLSL